MSDFFNEVSAAAEASSRQTNTFYDRAHYRSEDPTGVFGRDGGADYARYIYPSLERHIRDESRRKTMAVVFHPRVSGPSAREGFIEELKALLPSFAIEWKGGSIEIGWAPSQAE